MGDLQLLVPDMRAKVLILEGALAQNKRLAELGYAFRRGETGRTLTTQMAYYSRSRMAVVDVKAMFKAAGLWSLSDVEAQTRVTDTLDSMHIKGKAVDYVPTRNGKDDWNAPLEVWQILGDQAAAAQLDWGGNWGKTATKLGWDCPHVQLRE